jgi:hypothetical protein
MMRRRNKPIIATLGLMKVEATAEGVVRPPSAPNHGRHR